MEGRLLPKYQGRYQAHPVGYWQDEFSVAKQLGLDCIELILDYNNAKQNPLLKDGGIDELQAVIEKTGVAVYTVCADYFMEAPLHSTDSTIADQSQKVMLKLLENSSKLGVTDVVVPCVDQSTLDGQETADRFVERMKPMVAAAEELGVNLSLETDLSPQPFVDLLDRFDSDRVTVNYDIGNSAALGYDPVEELAAYGHSITDIHIKDRVRNGGPVMLGEGDADFERFFQALERFDYKGPFIMQAYRDDEGVTVFKDQLVWVQKYLGNYTA
ncbi:MAG: TIM barrel protein [Candidatus Marinimicrobia bacterium]|nr:TIM barrel protein [Candidatus Neomarinimicrobiota bacterium]